MTPSSPPFTERSWSRVELVSMDPQGDDMTIALYREETPSGPIGIVHTYSDRPGATARVAFVAGAMRTLGGMTSVSDDDPTVVAFPCGTWHAAAARRVFVEAVKVDQTGPVEARPLRIVDRKTGQVIRAEPLGGGAYRISGSADADGAEPSRAPGAARGLRKLAELPDAGDDAVCAFPCGHEHDALVGLLLPRAVNVRQAIREEEAIAGRGLLTAPGAQE